MIQVSFLTPTHQCQGTEVKGVRTEEGYPPELRTCSRK